MDEQDLVGQETARIRQKLLDGGMDKATSEDWAFLRTDAVVKRIDSLALAIHEHMNAPVDGNGNHTSRRQAMVRVAVPTVTGAGILAVSLEILRALGT